MSCLVWQAARKLPVYQCLVEGCAKLCASVGHRRQHLVDAHQFPSNYDFSRMHLMLHGGQLRPQEQLQKGRSQLGADPSLPVAQPAFRKPGSDALGGQGRAPGDEEGASVAPREAGVAAVAVTSNVSELAAGMARLETGGEQGAAARGRGRTSTRGRWFGIQQRGR